MSNYDRHTLEYHGRTVTFREIADRLDLDTASVYSRKRRGWTNGEVFETPKGCLPERILRERRNAQLKDEMREIREKLDLPEISVAKAMTMKW